jgi:hypothetical protein
LIDTYDECLLGVAVQCSTQRAATSPSIESLTEETNMNSPQPAHVGSDRNPQERQTTGSTRRPTMTTTQETELHESETLLVVNEDRLAQPSTQPADPPFYRKLLYLMLGLPLGILYLTAVLTGVGLGVGLMPLALLGVPTTIGLWYINRALLRLERNLANTLLGARIGPIDPVPRPSGGLWQQFRTIATDRYGWKGMVYLLLRFPVGLFTFTVTVTLAVLSLSLTLAPTYMWVGGNRVWLGQWFDSYLWSFALVPVGIIVGVATIYTTNMLANACRQWTTGALR